MMKRQGLRRGVCLLLALLTVLALPAAALEQVVQTDPEEVVTEEVTESPWENVEEPEQATAAEPATEPETEAPTEAETEAPAEPETEAPAEAETEAPAEPETEAPTEAETEAPAETVTEAPAEAETEAPAETVTETVTEAPAEAEVQEPAEAPSEVRYVDEQGHYLAPEELVVLRTMTMEQVLAQGQEPPAPAAENLFDRYTGVVAFYDYKAEAEIEQEEDRFQNPYFFYYQDGILQREETYVPAQGWLDLRAPAVLQGDVLPESEQALALREVYVGREVYVDTEAESHPAYLFVFNLENADNGLFTGQRDEVSYVNGLAAAPEVIAAPEETAPRAAVNPADITLVPGKDSIKVSWKATEGAASYTLSRSEEKGAWVVLKEGLTATSYTDTTAAAGKRYYYTVQSKTGETLSELVDTRTNEDNAVCLHTPLTLTATSGKGGVSLSWTGDKAATGYRVLRKEKGAANWSTLTTITDPKTLTLLDKRAANGTSYVYGVRAFYGPAEKISAIAETSQQHWGAIAQKAITPLSFTTVYSSADGLVMKWKAAQNVSGYQINYRTTPNGKWAGAVDVGKNTTYTLKGAKDGTDYYLAIRTYTKGGNGKTTYSGWTIYATPDTYHAVTKVKAVAVPKGVQITWSVDANAKGYRVFRKAGGKTTALASLTAKGKTASYIDPAAKLTSGTKYQYTVRAYYGSENVKTAALNIADNWGAFQWVSLQYLAAPRVTAAANHPTGTKVQWKSVTGAAGYNIYRKSGKKSWALVGTVGKGSITTFMDTSISKLPSGTAVTYTVRAFNAKKELGSYDSTGRKLLYLAKVEDVKVKEPKSSGTTLSWNAQKGADSYLVYRKDKNKGAWKKLGMVYGTTYVDSTLTARGGFHAYTVKAVGTLDGKSYSGAWDDNGFSYGILWKGKERGQWVKKDGGLYYVDDMGYLMTGWQYIKRNGRTYKYYFDEKTGEAVTNMYHYFGVKMREMPTFIEVWLDRNDTYASHVNIMLYDSDTDSYCIPAITFRCIANLETTHAYRGHGTAYIPKSGNLKRFVQLIDGGSYERYPVRIKGSPSFFHSLLYRRPDTHALMASTYNSMINNRNNSVACVRCQDIFCYLICDITENGYGKSHRIGVNIYHNKHDSGPYGIPKVDKISGSQNYDPTDPAVTGKFFYDTQVKEGGKYITAKAGAPTWIKY